MNDTLMLVSDSPAVPTLHITPAAIKRVENILMNEETNTFLRIRVDGGGCSGFQYHFSFGSERQSDDITYSVEGIDIVIDEASLTLMADSTLDFVEDMVGSSFVIKNPNAVSACGCGNSFSII